MKNFLELELNSVLKEGIFILSESDSLEKGLSNILIEYLTYKIQELNFKILKDQEQHIQKSIKEGKLLNSDLTIPVSKSQQNLFDEKEALTVYLKLLENLKQKVIDEEEITKYRSMFFGLKEQNSNDELESILSVLKDNLKINETPGELERIDFDNLRKWTVQELRELCYLNEIKIPSRIRKKDIIELIKDHKNFLKPLRPGKDILPTITNEKILKALSRKEWYPITTIIFNLKIKNMIDARFLQIKLKNLERSGKIQGTSIKGKQVWRLQ